MTPSRALLADSSFHRLLQLRVHLLSAREGAELGVSCQLPTAPTATQGQGPGVPEGAGGAPRAPQALSFPGDVPAGRNT